LFKVEAVHLPSGPREQAEPPGSWIWATYAQTNFHVGDRTFSVQNFAGTIYLSFWRMLPTILDVIPEDLRPRICSTEMLRQEERSTKLTEMLSKRINLDDEENEEIIGDCLGALWAWQKHRIIDIYHVPEKAPDVWFWSDGEKFFVEALIPKTKADQQGKVQLECITKELSFETFYAAVDSYRKQIQHIADTYLSSYVADGKNLTEWRKQNLVFLKSPFSSSSNPENHEPIVEWDTVRIWYRRLDML
jgi:hypothetical protein